MPRNSALARLAAWARLPAGTPGALEQLRVELKAIGMPDTDRLAITLAIRVVRLAEELHHGVNGDAEYAKRARLNYALAHLCWHLEAQAAREVADDALRLLRRRDDARPPY